MTAPVTWVMRDHLADRILLLDQAEEVGVRYHALYRLARLLGLEFAQHPTSHQFEVPLEAARQLRDEHARVRALQQRSLKLAAVAHGLDRAVSTIRLMAKRGDLEVDPETVSNNAIFVTRASVERCGNSSKREFQRTALPLAEVVRFTDAAGSNCSTSFVSAFSMRFLGAVRASSPHRVPLLDDRKRLIVTTTTSRNRLVTSTVGSCQRLGPSGLLYL